MSYDSISEIDDETTIYVRTQNGSFDHLGRFSTVDDVYDALEKRYDTYVGKLQLFTLAGSYTLPRPFANYTDEEIETIEDIVTTFVDSPRIAGGSTASPGGNPHVTRLDSKFDLSAKDYDFHVYITPDEERIDTSNIDTPCPFGAQFDALADELDLRGTVEYVAGTTYLPERGARRHNTRLYGRYVPDDPTPELTVQRAARARDDVADAFPPYTFRTGYLSWVNESGDLYNDLDGVDLLVAVNEGRPSVRPGDVDDYDILTSSSMPFDYEELVDILTPIVEDIREQVNTTVDIESVGVQTVTMGDIGDLPVAGLSINPDND